jgi:hypothetical protein
VIVSKRYEETHEIRGFQVRLAADPVVLGERRGNDPGGTILVALFRDR